MDDDERLLAYMHGRLTPSERAVFEAEMEARPALGAELAAMRALADGMAADLPDPSVQREGWARLSQSLAQEALPQPANDNRWPRFAQLAGVAAAAVIAWQLIAVPFLPQVGGDSFTPASQVESDLALRIAFTEAASLADVQTLLRETGARVVDGPSATGLFTLAFEDEAAREAAQAALAARDDLVVTVSRP